MEQTLAPVARPRRLAGRFNTRTTISWLRRARSTFSILPAMARSRSPRRSASSTTGSARPEYSRPTLAWLQITINAGASDAIYLRGLNIDGLGTGGYGVLFNSGGSLAVTNCVVRHFSSTGIGIAPSSGTTLFSITNTIVSDNGTTGIYLGPVGTGSAKGTVTSVEASRNYIGIVVEGGGSTGTATFVLVSDASANNNSYAGISAEGAVKLAAGPKYTQRSPCMPRMASRRKPPGCAARRRRRSGWKRNCARWSR